METLMLDKRILALIDAASHTEPTPDMAGRRSGRGRLCGSTGGLRSVPVAPLQLNNKLLIVSSAHNNTDT